MASYGDEVIGGSPRAGLNRPWMLAAMPADNSPAAAGLNRTAETR